MQKIMKRILALSLAGFLLLGTGTVFAEDGSTDTDHTVLLTLPKDQTTPAFTHGEAASLPLRIINRGSTPIKNITITPTIAESTDQWPFEIENRDETIHIDNLGAGQETPLTYQWKTRDGVTDRYYKTEFTVTYERGTQSYEMKQYVYIRTIGKAEAPKSDDSQKKTDDSQQSAVQPQETAADTAGSVTNMEASSSGGSGSSGGSVPRVIVTGFTTDPGAVKAGSNFRLTVKLKNTSASTAVKNMILSFSASTEGKDDNTAPAFLPVSGANTVYVSSIAANAESDVAIDLNAKQDLIQKPYNIELSMKYEDKNNTQYDATSSVAIPIRQDARFEFSKIEVNPDAVAVGEDADVTTNLYNLGKIKLYNVKARVEGNSITAKEAFLGNVDSGATAAIDIMAAGAKETSGAEKAKLILTYEDSDGKETTVEKEFEITVTAAAAETNTTAALSESTPKKSPLLPIIILILAGAGGTGAVIAYKKAKKEKDEWSDEMDGSFEDEQK